MQRTRTIVLPVAVALGVLSNLAGAADDPVLTVRAVMTREQVVQILDETVDWYRTLGAQQQSATQPSDLLILYANRQTADKVVNLAFEIARANAELISSEADIARRNAEASGEAPRTLARIQQQLDARRGELQSEIAAASKDSSGESQARRAELQSELDLVNARRNLLSTMSQFEYQSDANGSGASALKEHIDAIAASIPSAGGGTASANASASGTPQAAVTEPDSGSFLDSSENGTRRLGIWDLTTNVLRLSEKIRTIDAIDERTAALQETFAQIRTPPLARIKALSERGDALAAEANASNAGSTLKGVRDQFDTLAWLFKQTAAIVVPLSQEGVLLTQYRRNLKSWRDATQEQYYDALQELGARVALLLAALAIVYAAAEVWRRVVFRYVHEPRRRAQVLLARKIVMWTLVIVIVGFTLATELSSLATFAGLITAGLAVAMQSVLVSIVGYFFLIGRYGIRVGDRVQIGNVTGEVIDLGLVRLHLMELAGDGLSGPTGRVVAFANSIVFQASGGVFKQIPGVNLAWHEIALTLPPASDYSALKEKLLQAANHVIGDYREDIARQSREIQKTTSSVQSAGEVQALVQLKFSAASVDAIVRYPVQRQRAAEIDERMSRELLSVIESAAAAAAA
jgi:small-conductance mechanosensitive channel